MFLAGFAIGFSVGGAIGVFIIALIAGGTRFDK